jgi:hypothetical protein
VKIKKTDEYVGNNWCNLLFNASERAAIITEGNLYLEGKLVK